MPYYRTSLVNRLSPFLLLQKCRERERERVLGSLRAKVAGETGEMEDPVTGGVQVLLTSKEDPVSMRFLGAQYISKLVKIAGIAIAASRTKAKATYVTLICKNCRKSKQVPCWPGLGGAIVPRSCDLIPQAYFTPLFTISHICVVLSLFDDSYGGYL
ncbi:hypothetical protein I3760_09G220800 [Carya illinoinensis]|nr:hypothetical protein I3760_09G220800 [Carya illinoinensis]